MSFTLPPIPRFEFINNNKCRQKYTTRTFEISTFTQQPPKYAGKNTLFGRFRASFFLLNFFYPKSLRIVTNNTKFKDFTIFTDRNLPNRNFIFSHFINGVFRFLNFHKRFSAITCKKYFNIVRRHLHEQFAAIVRRMSNIAKCPNNNQTRTFFRFSVGKQTYYFGFHVPCESSRCCVPPTFVSKQGSHCWIHWRKRCQALTLPPPQHFPVMDNTPKLIVSQRLGISYTKEMSFSERLNKYFVLYKNFKRITFKQKQVTRFDRLTRSSQSNDAAKLITADKPSVSVQCHHFHHRARSYRPTRISLTRFVDDFHQAFPYSDTFGPRGPSRY
jgi:hypothetical protein